MMLIPLSYTPIDNSKLFSVLSRYEGQSHQQLVVDFERCLEGYAPGTFPVALQSGTAAIHLALKALGIGKGDHVIVPTFTYIATVNPILYEGAIPIFVDSEPDSWNVDPDVLRDAIMELVRMNKKPKAIIIVHTYGMPGNLGAIREISRHFEIPVLEDAAEAIGSSYQGRAAGMLGDIGILSFNNNKILTTYGGGAVLCPSEVMGKKVLFWATQSREAMPYYLHQEIGYNYRMCPLSAATGIAQWDSLENLVQKRREIRMRYMTELQGAGWVGQMESLAKTNGWLTAVVNASASSKKSLGLLFAEFVKEGIEVRPLWNPLHGQPLFKECKFFGGNVARTLFERGICLPSSGSLSEAMQDRVVRILVKM